MKNEYGFEIQDLSMQEMRVGFGGFPGNIGHFISNAAKTVGKEVGKVTKPVVKATGQVTKAIGKIPVVGAPVKTVFDATYHAAVAPAKLAVDVAINGKRIDKAVMAQVNTAVKDVKAVGPYAQTVVSLVPGVGTGISAGLGAGLALANGQRIDQALLAGVKGALPGGPLARAAMDIGIAGVQAAASGKKLNIGELAKTAGGAALGSLGLPPAARDAMLSGVALAGQLANGQPLDKALADAAISVAPVDTKTKAALAKATQISVDLAHGKPVDRTLLAHAADAIKGLPVDEKLKAQLSEAAKTGKAIAPGTDQAKALAHVLHASVASSLTKAGEKHLPKEAHKNLNTGLRTGLVMGTATVTQARRAHQLTNVAANKLVQSGIELAKANPAIAEARKLAGKGIRGFDLGSGLASQHSQLFDIIHLRDSLTGVDKMGFDMALATRTGLVTNPPVKGMSPAAAAGHALTLGMQGHDSGNKQSIMAAIQTNPSAKAGASTAIRQIAVARESFMRKVLRALRLAK